jgi:hypothetical protein
MPHLTEEQLVMHRYGEDDDPSGAEEHLRSCQTCRGQYETVGRVLSMVTDAPIPERGQNYGAEVWNRLRWKLGTPRRSRRLWQSALAAAAMLALAFFAGQLWRDRQGPSSLATVQRQPVSSPAEAGAPFATAQGADRVLLLVVSDHLDSSERILLELVNADPGKRFDTVDQQKRAEELVSSNRIYRQTAQRQGEKRIASVLADLEPILVELSNSRASLDQRKLAGMQKRIESRGLLFKVRVVGAQVTSEERTPPGGTNSL